MAEKEHGESLSQPHTRPSIFEGQRSGRCHLSRRDRIKDVLLRRLIIRHLHTRTRNLYPSSLPLPCLRGTSKCIVGKSKTDTELQVSLGKFC